MATGRIVPRSVMKLQYVYVLLAVILLGFVKTSGHDQQRALEIVFLCLAGLTAALGPSPVQLPDRGTFVALGVFFGFGIVSGLLADVPRYAFYEISSLVLLLLVALSAGRAMAHQSITLHRVLQLVGGIAALYTLKIAVVYGAVWLLNAVPEAGDFTPGFSNIRHFNHVETVGLPLLALLYVLSPKSSRLRALTIIPAAVWWAVLLATGGRGTAIGLLAGVAVVLVLRRRAALPLLRALVLACVAGIAVYTLFFVALPVMAGRPPFGEAGSLIQRTVADPSSGRTLLWKLAVELIAAHPWLGVGPLHFAHYGAKLNLGAHPHDWVLQIAVEWGVPALLALCTAIGFALRALWRAGQSVGVKDTESQNMFSAWLLIGVAILVDGLVSGNIVMPQSQLMIVLYLACAIGWTTTVSRARPAALATGGSILVRLIAISAVVTLAWSVAPQFVDKATADMAKPRGATIAELFGYTWPRLWRDGFF
jgi:putative inorganic carbon (hco3(-)) transporter